MTAVSESSYAHLISSMDQLRIGREIPDERRQKTPNIYYLRLVKEYHSDFPYIQKAIDNIPSCIGSDNISSVIKELNSQLIGYKNAANCPGNICSLEQLQHLEQQLQLIKVKELQQYRSESSLLNKAIEKIDKKVNVQAVSRVIMVFNKQIEDAKKTAFYNEPIFSVEQIKELEDALEDCDESLKELWRVLPTRPSYTAASSMRAWLRSYLNHDLLYKETKVCLTGRSIVRLPREILQLRNLQELDISENKISILHEWIDGCT